MYETDEHIIAQCGIQDEEFVVDSPDYENDWMWN